MSVTPVARRDAWGVELMHRVTPGIGCTSTLVARVFFLMLTSPSYHAIVSAQVWSIDHLHEAIAQGNAATPVIQHINALRNIDAVSSEGYTTLMAVARAVPERANLFFAVLERKPNIELRTSRGESALLLAAGAGNAQIVTLLIANKANPNGQSSEFGSPITVAASNRRWPVVLTLLKAGANVNIADTYKRTPLQFASVDRQWSLVEQLLQRGADPNVADNVTGNSPLMWASTYGNAQIVRLMVSKGANPNLRNPHTCSTALHSAAYSGSVDVLKVLVDQGAQPEAADRNGLTALAVAIANKRADSVSMLTAIGAPASGEPFEFCTISKSTVAVRPQGVGLDFAAQLRSAGSQWQLERVRFLDPTILNDLVQEGELFWLTLCGDDHSAVKCNALFGNRFRSETAVKGYLDDRLLTRKTRLRGLAARLSDVLQVEWSRTGWPEERNNFDGCVRLPAEYSVGRGSYLNGNSPETIGALTMPLCLQPGAHRILSLKADKTWELLNLEVLANSPDGPKLFTERAQRNSAIISNRVVDAAVSECSDGSNAKQNPLKRPPARDLLIEERSATSEAFSLEVQIIDSGNRCSLACRNLLGRVFLEALLQWTKACRLCKPANFAVVKLDGLTMIDFSRLSLGAAIRSLDEMNRFLDGTRSMAIRGYQDFSPSSDIGKQICLPSSPQFIKDELCSAPAMIPETRRILSLELQEGDLICGKSTDALVACASDKKIQLNSRFFSFSGLTEIAVVDGKVVRRPVAIGAGNRTVDLRRVLVHELGHFFGLPHSDEAGHDIMAQYYSDSGSCLSVDDKSMVNSSVDHRWTYRLLRCSGQPGGD